MAREGGTPMPRILVIEDDDPIRTLMHQILERAGYAVAEACDGGEGLRVCHTTPVDLVLTDLMMPGLDGVATIGAIREQHPTPKIIVMSGRDVRRDPQMVDLVACHAVHGILV